jgi:hypothetical protein
MVHIDHYYVNQYKKMIGVYFGATPVTSLKLCVATIQAQIEEHLGANIDKARVLFGVYKNQQDDLIDYAFNM